MSHNAPFCYGKKPRPGFRLSVEDFEFLRDRGAMAEAYQAARSGCLEDFLAAMRPELRRVRRERLKVNRPIRPLRAHSIKHKG